MTSKKDKLKQIFTDIKTATDYQDVDGWYTNSKRMISYMGGDFGQSSYDNKYIVNTVYNLVNILIPNLYYQDPFIKARATKKHIIRKEGDKYLMIDASKCAYLIELGLNELVKKLYLQEEVRQVIQDVLLTGVGWVKIGISGTTGHDEDTEGITSNSQPYCQRVCWSDILFDPMSTGPENARFIIHKFTKTLDEVKANKNYKNTEKLEETSLSTSSPKKTLKDKSNSDVKILELYEYHNQTDDTIQTVVRDGKVKEILWDRKNPHNFNGSHFVMLKFTGDNDKLLGLSPVMMVEDEILAANETFSLMLNHLRQFPGLVMYEEGAMDDDQVTAFENGEQGAILQVENGAIREGRVKREAPLSMGFDYYNSISTVNNLIDRVLGISASQRAPQSGKRKSATEITVESNDADLRRIYYLGFVKRFVLTISSKLVGLMQQYYDDEEWIKTTGEFEEWVKYTKKDIQGEYVLDFDIDNIRAYSASRAQGILQTMQIIAQYPLLQPMMKKIDPDKLAEVLFKNMDVSIDSISKDIELQHYELSPFEENQQAKSGKLIPDPHPGEPQAFHKSVHTVAMTQALVEGNKELAAELARHIEMHTYIEQQAQSIPGQMAINPVQSEMGGTGTEPAAQANVPSPVEAQAGFVNNSQGPVKQ